MANNYAILNHKVIFFPIENDISHYAYFFNTISRLLKHESKDGPKIEYSSTKNSIHFSTKLEKMEKHASLQCGKCIA